MHAIRTQYTEQYTDHFESGRCIMGHADVTSQKLVIGLNVGVATGDVFVTSSHHVVHQLYVALDFCNDVYNEA